MSEVRSEQLGYNPHLNNQDTYDHQLYHDRRQTRQRLRRRFEHIFAKFERNFEGIGDEIDLETGDIVVDNGHIRNMRHEADTGTRCLQSERPTPSRSVMRQLSSPSLAQSGRGATKVSVVETFSVTGLSLDLEGDGYHSPGRLGDTGQTEDELALDSLPAHLAESSRPTPPLHSRKKEVSTIRHLQSTASDNMSEQVSALKSSLQAFQTQLEGNRSEDAATFQALGTDITRQLSKIISDSGSRGIKRKRAAQATDSAWQFPEIASRSEEDRRQIYRCPSPVRMAPLSSSPCNESLWAPPKHIWSNSSSSNALAGTSSTSLFERTNLAEPGRSNSGEPSQIFPADERKSPSLNRTQDKAKQKERRRSDRIASNQAQPGANHTIGVQSKVKQSSTSTNVKMEPNEADDPRMSLTSLISYALESGNDDGMTAKDVIKHIEERFPFYRKICPAWKGSIKDLIHKRPQFEKVGDAWPFRFRTKRRRGRPPKKKRKLEETVATVNEPSCAVGVPSPIITETCPAVSEPRSLTAKPTRKTTRPLHENDRVGDEVSQIRETREDEETRNVVSLYETSERSWKEEPAYSPRNQEATSKGRHEIDTSKEITAATDKSQEGTMAQQGLAHAVDIPSSSTSRQSTSKDVVPDTSTNTARAVSSERFDPLRAAESPTVSINQSKKDNSAMRSSLSLSSSSQGTADLAVDGGTFVPRRLRCTAATAVEASSNSTCKGTEISEQIPSSDTVGQQLAASAAEIRTPQVKAIDSTTSKSNNIESSRPKGDVISKLNGSRSLLAEQRRDSSVSKRTPIAKHTVYPKRSAKRASLPATVVIDNGDEDELTM